MARLLGDGSDIIDAEVTELDELREEVRQLKRDLATARAETATARREATAAMGALRKQLSPLYRALQMVFGELDAAGIDEQGANVRTSGAWDEWKTRLGPGCAKVIDTLLLGGEMTIQAITVSAHMGKRTVYEATAKMGQVGILVRNGNKFSLKKP